MPNCDSTTGVAYGVISGNHVPELDQEIFENGNDETFEAWKEDAKKSIRLALEDLDLPELLDNNERSYDERQEAMEEALVDLLRSEDWDVKRLRKSCMQCADVINGVFDIDQVTEDIIDCEAQSLEIDEPEHTYVVGDTHYLRGHLGGASLIWVTKSRYVTPCSTCSPCVPGAGCLDTPRLPEHANCLAYCPPPEDFCHESPPYVIYHTDERGFPTDEVAWRRPLEQ